MQHHEPGMQHHEPISQPKKQVWTKEYLENKKSGITTGFSGQNNHFFQP